MINELSLLNSSRGSFSYSITTLDYKEGHFHNPQIFRDFGSFNIDKVPEKKYKICHIQDPTGYVRNFDTIHPAEKENSLLWHNGIIKEYCCEVLREKQQTDCMWDTQLLLNELNDFKNLDEIDGSFACFFFDKDIFVFRNLLAPLFFSGSNFSSMRYDDTFKPLEPEKIFCLTDLTQKEIFNFKTKDNPWWMMDK